MIPRRPSILAATLALFATFALTAPPTQAKELAGVRLPDRITVAGQPLLLNGMGLREKVFIDVYVAGLYLPSKTTDAEIAIRSDVPKRIEMVMRRSVDRAKLAETMRDSIRAAGAPEAAAHADTLAGWMEDVAEDDRIVLEYLPGKGTTVTVKGKLKGTIEGPAFMRAVWGIYLGPNPPTEALKKGLLGR